jgi:hypothetical protein
MRPQTLADPLQHFLGRSRNQVGRTPEDLKLALACELGDESTFQEYLARNPDATKTLSDAERRKLPT